MSRRPLLKWFNWSVLAWAIFGIVNGTQVCVGMYAAGMHHNWTKLFMVYALSWIPWAIATPWVLWLGDRYPARRSWHLHGIAYLTIALTNAGWATFLGMYLQPLRRFQNVSPLRTWVELFYSKFHTDLFVYGGILALGLFLYSRETLANREQQLAKERLDSLRSQLQPHFLFNTLNGISGLIRTGRSETAIDMIAGLSDLLRRVVDGRASSDSALSEEIGFLKQYIDLQQMRLGDRLSISYDIDPSLHATRVPSLLLQPLVENALVHGIAPRVEGGAVLVSIREYSNDLLLSVRNSGSLPHAMKEGVGLTNTRARLASQFGSQAALTIRQLEPDLVEAEIRIARHA